MDLIFILLIAVIVIVALFDFTNGFHDEVVEKVEEARSYYDKIVHIYVLEMAELAEYDDCKKLFVYKEILSQLREIGKRIHITANTLEDIVIKMD